MKRILVTGGAGYIGSHACKLLADSGYLPICFDNLSRGHREAVKWGPLVVDDLLDRSALSRLMSEHQPDAVMHFAALAYVGESVVKPADYYENNVQGTLNLLQAMRQAEIKKLVFSSTCAVYGNPQYLPLDEAHPCRPINPYGSTKRIIEQMLVEFHRAYGLASVSLRYFNAAGADPEGLIGEKHDPETHLIPLAMDAASGQRPSLDIFGGDYATEDGTCVRDYVHVNDLASAHIAALKRLDHHNVAEIYNLGTGQGYSVQQIIDAVEQVAGQTVQTRTVSRRNGDPASLVASATQANSTLGWVPKHSDLRTLIDHAWRWHRQQLNIDNK